MRKGKILRRIAMLISFVMLITSTVNTTYGFIVTSTDSVINIFVPDDMRINGITLDKTVEHPFGDEYKIPDNISFDFKIELGSYYANTKLTTTAGEMTADADGNLTVTVKPGVSLGIEGLEEGTVVKVTELDTSLSGFALKGEATKSVTVGADGNATINFINTYTPESVKPSNVTVNGIKILEGRDWLEGDSFSFKLEQRVGDTWVELGSKTVRYDAENAEFNFFSFSEIVQALTFDKIGIYSFRMSEIVGNMDNVDYDETVNHFTVKVTDVDMDGKLEISTVTGTENVKVSETNGKYAVSVTFNNTFVPPVIIDPDPITVDIEVNKKIENTGTRVIGPEGFEFVLENVANGEKLALISDANGKARFELTFTKADVGNTYTYKLSETDNDQIGMTYDDDIYDIKINISLNDDDQLVASLTVNGAQTEKIAAEFINVYEGYLPEAPPTGDNNDITFWFIMMIISGTTFIILTVADIRKRKSII